MATIIENRVPEPMSRSVLVDNTDSGAGWAVAIIVLVAALFVGAFWYMRTHAPAATPATPGTVQVNLPSSGYQPSGTNGSTQSSQSTSNTTSGSASTQTAPSGGTTGSNGSAQTQTTPAAQ